RLREDVLATIESVNELREVLIKTAAAHDETIMPGYTHLQPAQPTTVAHWALSYESTLRRDTERLLEAYSRVNQSPLGAAAFAGTPFDIDRDRTAELLGFDSVLENAMDAAASRDVLIEVAGHHATLATTLSGLAEDLVLFAHRGFVDLDDDYASTSSIMPQKKNPDTLELVRATAGDATSGLAGLLTTIKGLPRAYNRDLQQATPHVWAAVDAVAEATTVSAGAIETLSWNEATLGEAAGEGFSTATGVADALAMSGLPFRTAHEAVAIAADNGADIEAIAEAVESITGDPLETYVDRETIETTLSPAASVAIRDSQGGPAPAVVDDALNTARETLAGDQQALAETHEALAAAETTLQDEVGRYG
ncbi:MAG: argininosuccinate lyase, partial [Natrialbaceae archaeon]|nr:argininosuccinate lyase [Natrialbaceae archaeon]